MAKLYFYYSAMNAGKSTTLLQSSHNYRERGMETLLYCPAFDDRYGKGLITSRIGLEANAFTFNEEFDIYQDVKQRLDDGLEKLSCVLIDEAQFLSKTHVEQLCEIADELNIPVLSYGLRTDFIKEPFPGSKYLLAWADEVIEIKTICHCGKKATMNMRIDEQGKPITHGAQVCIGGNDRYVALCRRHFKSGEPA